MLEVKKTRLNKLHLHSALSNGYIDLFHNGGQIKYSFVLMLISLTSLAMTRKISKEYLFQNEGSRSN